MNLEKLARTVGIVVGAALLAAALQGCGSGGDNGSAVSQAVYDALQADYARAVTERDAAQAARRTAEAAASAAQAARATAEGAAADAREAQAAAETLRDAAVAAQAAAETARATAQAAKTKAEAAARDAEAARAKVEGERHVANVDKAVAEQAARTAKEAQAKAERAQAAVEAAQKAAEQAQAAAEAAQKAAEAARKTAETERDAARQARERAEVAAAAAETAQTTAEAERDAARDAQARAETERDAAVALLNKQTAAGAAQWARLDAAAIRASAGYTKLLPGVDYNGDGDFTKSDGTLDSTTEANLGRDVNGDGDTNDTIFDVLPKMVSSTNTVAGYQGSQAKPDALRIRVWHSGPTVQFTAASGTGSARQTHFRLSTAAGPVLTSLRKQTDVPGGHTRHVYLVTDIEPPRQDVFRDHVPPGVSYTLTTAGAGYHAATQQTRYALVKADNTANTDVINVATTSAITLDPPAALTPTDAISSRAVADGLSIPGTYAYAPGTYVCNGGNAGDCALALNADGELTMQADGAWLFVPDGTITVTDKDYLLYGAWLMKPDSQGGTAYAAALSAGNDLFAAGNIARLSGKAAYKGSAAGFFAERHIASDTAVSGTFSATAELAADFATAATPQTATTGGTLSGTVRDFIRSDGVSVDWLVMLGQVTLPTQNTADGGFAAGDTSGFASGAVWEGEWGVQLVGDGVAPAQHPSGVIGTFGAQHGAPVRLTDEPAPGETVADEGFVAVIGGFGARKQ